MKRKKIAVVLSGCGNKDGAEITEAVSLMIGLTRAGAEIGFFAPNIDFTPKNFLTNELLKETRNVMVESARISRSQMQDINSLVVRDFDGLAFPGGYGAALHLSTWATKGASCEVLLEVKRTIESFYREKKPIAAICIAPTLVAKVLGSHQVTVTIGNDKETIGEICRTGAKHELCPVEDFISDRDHKIVTTPAYMYGEAKYHQVYEGIQALVREFIEMA